MIKSLFAYPGNKAKLIQTLNISADTQVFIDPFFGGGSFAFHAIGLNPKGKFVIAEKDKTIQNILRACQSQGSRVELIRQTSELVTKFLANPDPVWQSMKLDLIKGDAATKMLHQRLAFGAVARTGSNGVYNVVYSKDKAVNLPKWKPSLPDLEGLDLTILNDWRECFNIPCVDYQDAIALIDPPYYAPKKTSCYPEHKPKDIMTALTVLSSVDATLAARVSKFWLTHYNIDLIQEFLNQVDDSDYTVIKTIGARLDQIGQGVGNYKNGSRVQKKVVYRDCLWEFARLSN